jgi:hypothetical protein
MGVILRVLLLLELCILPYGAVAVDTSEIEVALAADGTVLDENRPFETVAKSVNQEVGVHSSVGVPEAGGDVADPMRGLSSVGSEKENDVMATLQRELTEVEQMVALQRKKLQVLERMRATLLEEQQEVKVQQGEEVARRRSRIDVGEVIERRLEAAVAETAAERMSARFDTYFVERAVVELNGEVAGMKMLKLRASGAEELVAVAYTDGIVVFSTSGGEELLRVDTQRQGIRSIALEAQDEQPCLVVTYDAPVIAFYTLHLVDTNTAATAATTSQDPKSEQQPPFTVSIRAEYTLDVDHHRTFQLSATASAVSITRGSRQLVVAVAQTDGVIDFLASNGTSLRRMQTNASITALETRRNLLAFSNGTDIVVSSLTRAQGSVLHVCPGSSAEVSSIAFDAMQPEILYAGTHRGEILVYAVNAGTSAEDQACRLLSRSSIMKRTRDASPVALAATKAHVIASGPRGIVVFNVSKSARSGVSLSMICSKSMRPRRGSNNMPAMAFSEGKLGAHLAFVTTDESGQGQLLVLHSLLPDDKEMSDFQWTTMLYVGVVLVAVVGSQLFIRWQQQTSVNPWDSIGKGHDMPFGKYGGLKDHNATDFDGEGFGRYNSLSDELRRKIAQAKKGSTQRPMDDEGDY